MAFEQATAIQQVDPHTYSAHFHDDWCIGAVPHGGYVTSTLQKAVQKHFETTLSTQDHPHTLALHLDFLRRTQTGPAKFIVKHVKLGRQTSVIHVTLSQDGREEVVGTITQSNLNKERGITFDTHWQPRPKPLPLSSTTSALDRGQDPHWTELLEWPNSGFSKATRQIRAWFPRTGQVQQNLYDMWTCLRNPCEAWTNEKLGFLVDMFPPVCEAFILQGPRRADQYDPTLVEPCAGGERRTPPVDRVPLWYPTLLLNLDIKKALPEGGTRFLFTRVQTKAIRNGRYDVEIVVLDESGDIVALSHHVCFAVSAERNLAARKKTTTTTTTTTPKAEQKL